MQTNQSIELDAIIDDDRWTKTLPDAQKQADRAVRSAFATAGYEKTVSLTVLLSDDSAVQILNRDFRGKDAPTNVLSFPTQEMPRIPGEPDSLGDIVLAFDTLIREAAESGREFVDHFLHLIVHASLHLIGYTHEVEQEAEAMEALEIAALAGLGVSNPYVDDGAGQGNYGTREQ